MEINVESVNPVVFGDEVLFACPLCKTTSNFRLSHCYGSDNIARCAPCGAMFGIDLWGDPIRVTIVAAKPSR